jgi:hypothetical protein
MCYSVRSNYCSFGWDVIQNVGIVRSFRLPTGRAVVGLLQYLLLSACIKTIRGSEERLPQ